MSEHTEEAIRAVEARRHVGADVEAESGLSVNDFVGRVKDATLTAHTAARGGQLGLEYEAWADVAAIAVARMEVILAIEALDG